MKDEKIKIIPKPKPFCVKVECLVPTTVSYRVIALNEQDALKEVDKITAVASSVQQNIRKKIKLKAAVYVGNTSMLKLTKIYRAFK